MCGGAVTEPGYFDGLKLAFRNPAVKVCVKKKGKDPSALAEYSATIRDQHADTFDEVWCVVDVDEYDVAAAKRQAVDLGVRLAVSNPCFEVWLLLHFVDCTAHLRDPADAMRRLKRHVPDYTKRELRFGRFEAGVPNAIGRARGLGEEHVRNPSTGVWMIAETTIGEQAPR